MCVFIPTRPASFYLRVSLISFPCVPSRTLRPARWARRHLLISHNPLPSLFCAFYLTKFTSPMSVLLKNSNVCKTPNRCFHFPPPGPSSDGCLLFPLCFAGNFSALSHSTFFPLCRTTTLVPPPPPPIVPSPQFPTPPRLLKARMLQFPFCFVHASPGFPRFRDNFPPTRPPFCLNMSNDFLPFFQTVGYQSLIFYNRLNPLIEFSLVIVLVSSSSLHLYAQVPLPTFPLFRFPPRPFFLPPNRQRLPCPLQNQVILCSKPATPGHAASCSSGLSPHLIVKSSCTVCPPS